jgi:anaerobic ribonucleoside-triphosphate reductase
MSEKKNLDLSKDKPENSNKEFINKILPSVFMSTGDVQKFNPKNILDSVMKEGGLNAKNAKAVTELVVRRIIASGIKFLSGPHIRELVCSALSELGFEEERKRFTRIGMPIHDYEGLLDSKFNERDAEYTIPENIHRWAAGQLASEYALLKLLTTDQNKLHLSGDIHIHSLKYFDMRPFAQNWDIRLILRYGVPPVRMLNATYAKPAKNPITAMLHISRWLNFIHSEFSGNQGYQYFNTFLAPYMKGLNDKEIKQAAQTFIYEVNQQYIAQGSYLPVSNIVTSPTIPDVLKKVEAVSPGGIIKGTYGDYEQENLKLFNAISEIYTEGDGEGKIMSFPNHKVLIDKNTLNNQELLNSIYTETSKMGTPMFINGTLSPISTLGYLGPFFSNDTAVEYLNKTNKMKLFDWNQEFLNTGALQSVSINLPRIAIESLHDDVKLKENLIIKMDSVKNILLIKKSLIEKTVINKKLPMCSGIVKDQPIFDIRKQVLVFGIVGLNEMCRMHTGHQIHEDFAAVEFCKSILDLMFNQCKKYTKENNILFTIWEQPAEFTTHRFAGLDLTHYPEYAKKIVNGDADTHSVYYTPSTHVNYSAQIDLITRAKLHATIGKIIQNNTSLPIWLNRSNMAFTKDKWMKNLQEIVNTGVNEFFYSFDFNYCNKCGLFSEKAMETCPKCGVDVKMKQIARITDYYTPVELWNAGKRQEFAERKRYNL